MYKVILILTLAYALAMANIGTFAHIKGEVSVDRNSTRYQAALKMTLLEHDYIQTAVQSKAKILFQDQTVIQLGERSTFQISEYLYKAKNSKTELSIMKGVFKFVTGEIGKINPERFKIATKNAVIGIRGTAGGCLIEATQNSCYCSSGMIEVYNSYGSVVLKAGEKTIIKDNEAPSEPQKYTIHEYKKLDPAEMIESPEEIKTILAKSDFGLFSQDTINPRSNTDYTYSDYHNQLPLQQLQMQQPLASTLKAKPSTEPEYTTQHLEHDQDYMATNEAVGLLPETGNTDTGNTDTGNTDTGNTDTGNTDTGNTDTGNTDTGNTGTGNTDTGNTGTGNTGTGNTDTGNTDTGNTDTGNTDTGNTDTGNTDTGNTDTGNTDTGSLPPSPPSISSQQTDTQAATYKDSIMEYGYWMNTAQPSGVYISGDPTTAQMIEHYRVQNKTATYSGTIIGISNQQKVDGNIHLHADFGAQNITGEMMLTSAQSAYWKAQINSGSISHSHFSSSDITSTTDSVVQGIQGFIDGTFLGAYAQGAGGNIDLSAPSAQSVQAVFGAMQQ